ncbi:GNAT family N-acetyltransferase [Agrobacterium vaccinii]|uniref:GNAT family N-acetyltransferase n=1 Tax=Agrobacterium TaxID=357 RepID=UPI001E610129|nr:MULTISPECIES: N-acetyltransferase [Agrobacterium]UHS55347.1 GNAT family N-acetyltransferase [Agrobacterium vaccinii]UHS60050.1 GNAT family N-acetyltransferase [Agrobacterium vaccinii]
MFDDYLSWKPFFEIVPMEHGDCVDIAALHATRFPRAWNDGEFSGLLSQSSVFGAVARQTNAFFSKPLGGFVLSREAGGEAEILTIAVSDKFARVGLGWRLMQTAMREASMRGAETMFLEVDGANGSAIGLYQKLGFKTVAERRAYYTAKDGTKSMALVMRRDLR